jgi:PAS domain S-box-containing protein
MGTMISPEIHTELEALRKRVQQLEQNEQRLRAIFDNTTDVISVKDIHGRFEMINPAGVALFGMPLEEIIGHTQQELIPLTVSSAIDALEQEVLRTDKLMNVEINHLNERFFSATKFPFRAPTGDMVGLVSITREVSAQRLAEHEVERHKELLEHIITEAPTGIAYLDAQLIFRQVNQAYTAMWGIPEELFLGRSLYDVFPQTGNETLIDRVIAGGVPYQVKSFHYVQKSAGSQRDTYWDVNFVPTLNSEKVFQGLLVLTIEVSDRVQRERLQLAQLETMRDLADMKGRFVNSVSHELRTPLTTIKGYAEFLEDNLGGPLTPEQVEYVSQISRSTMRLESLVDELLDHALLDAGVFKLAISPDGDLDAKVMEVVASLRPQAKAAGLEIDVDLRAGANHVAMDERRIGQVLINLIANAIKFTPMGCVTVRTRRDGDWVLCEVEDTGIGIKDEDKGKLFLPFSQIENVTTRRLNGTGLGLNICKTIVDGHGGAIGARTDTETGTTFWFTLPLGEGVQ